eukprot:1763913-Rhodomonas_salina.3
MQRRSVSTGRFGHKREPPAENAVHEIERGMLSAYAFAIPCPVLTQQGEEDARREEKYKVKENLHALAAQCAVLIERMYAISGPDVASTATQVLCDVRS